MPNCLCGKFVEFTNIQEYIDYCTYNIPFHCKKTFLEDQAKSASLLNNATRRFRYVYKSEVRIIELETNFGFLESGKKFHIRYMVGKDANEFFSTAKVDSVEDIERFLDKVGQR